MRHTIAIVALATLGESLAGAQPGAVRYTDPRAWVIGPIENGRSFSRGMPATPFPHPQGWYFDFPQAPGSVNYVTFRHGSLARKQRIVMRYRIEAEPGARIVPKGYPHLPAKLTMYFQRAGDNWSGRGAYETFRWYATFRSQPLDRPGEYQLIVPLNGNWTAIQSSSARTQPAAFQTAISNADEVGFVLGGGDGYGHGANAIGRARLVVTDFHVE